MIQFALVCLILCIGLRYGAGDIATEYVDKAGMYLRLHTEPAVFWDAHNNCQREGGVLASPTTDAMVQAMRAAMTEHYLSSSSVFAGMAAQVKRDRSLKSFSKASLQWATGEPSGAADEQCLALTGAGALADVSCALAHPYFCRKERARKCSNGYEYDQRTGSCYKFHRTALAFRPALSTCRAEGGILAVIDSKIKSDVLKEIFSKNPEDVITGSHDPNHALVGFRKYADGEWLTIFGMTLPQAGFSQWAADEPNNLIDPELCGSIFRDGLLNDVSCTRALPYICEIRPQII